MQCTQTSIVRYMSMEFGAIYWLVDEPLHTPIFPLLFPSVDMSLLNYRCIYADLS